MNELIFFSHICVLSIFLLFCVKKGKTSLFIFTTLQPLFCNLFVLKQTTIFGMHVTTAEGYVVVSVLGMNLLREYYGVQEAKKAIFYSFLSMSLLAIMGQFQLLYKPSLFDFGHVHYQTLLESTPRIVFCSFLSFFISERLDLLIFSYLKKKFPARDVSFRYILSTLTSQLFDTIFLTYSAFYGVLDNLNELIIFSYAIKTITIFLSSFTAHFSKKFSSLNTN